MGSSIALRSARALRNQGKRQEALRMLRDAIRHNELDAEEIEKAGRFIDKELKGDRATPIAASAASRWI